MSSEPPEPEAPQSPEPSEAPDTRPRRPQSILWYPAALGVLIVCTSAPFWTEEPTGRHAWFFLLFDGWFAFGMGIFLAGACCRIAWYGERTYFPTKSDDLRGLRTMGLVMAIFFGPQALLASVLFAAHGSREGVLISGGVTLISLSVFCGVTKSRATRKVRYADQETARRLHNFLTRLGVVLLLLGAIDLLI